MSKSGREMKSDTARKSKRIYILPNLFTTANMFCGFYGIISAIHHHFITAAWAILASMLFDSMDGRVARLAHATSDFGVEYDSLSDLLSFGIAPALLMYLWCLEPYGRLGWLVAFFFVACAALRLARFNVNASSTPKGYFQGLPSPLAACTLGTAILFYNELGLAFGRETYVLLLMLILGSLMISTIRFPSFKEVRLSRESPFGLLALVVMALVLVAVRPEVTIFGMCIVYMIVGGVLDLRRVTLASRSRLRPGVVSPSGKSI